MASYHFNTIEKNWQKFWAENQTFKAENNSKLPKYYVLDMFPYPSGAGLHVGHPLGYIASDIVSRYKRHNGFNVLHPMGYDAFGLPAEQYAIQTGQHPAITTEENIKRYREQLDNIGFSFDWSREVRTTNPDYYRWTQWIFLQLFNAWYNKQSDKAEPISELIKTFETIGNKGIQAACEETVLFDAAQWKAYSEKEQQKILLNYRLAFLSETMVNWCPELGTVLANDEVKDGVSERGGYLVERKLMTQWSLRISAYAERLLQGLDTLDWTDSIKEAQRNWIGKSEGTSLRFLLTSPLAPLQGRGERISAIEKQGDDEDLWFVTADKKIYARLKEFALENRKNQTFSEDIIWQNIRDRQVENVKFRRQHIIDRFIADFVSFELKLIIEIDGLIHSLEENKISDEIRTGILNDHGFAIIRFTNEEVNADLEGVLSRLRDIIKKTKSTSSSPREKGVGDEVNPHIEVFTTRPDTIFGVSFLTLAPEHELVAQITTQDCKAAVDAYVTASKNRSERERMADVKTISGQFTGAYAVHPFTGAPIPIWIGDYVLAGYGTGAVMAVPAHDSRDYAFAKHFNLPIPQVVEGGNIELESYDAKEGQLINSDFLNGMEVKVAVKKAIEKIEAEGLGQGKTNYRLRNAVFGRQRYWGEPIPIYYKDEIPFAVDEQDLDQIILPAVDKFLPTETGEPPLARAANWSYKGYPLETTTMPGWAGSSWYYLRYMDPRNTKEFVSKEAVDYWQNIDLYIGGSEHAVGHLLYARFWCKFLKDIGKVPFEEPFKKLVNQGMIQGISCLVHRVNNENKFVSEGLKSKYETTPIHIDVNLVTNNIVDIEKLRAWRPAEFKDAEYVLEDGKLICQAEVGKMSKRWHNVVNPDDICQQYGADTLRMYEMFLGPLQDAKPWSTQGIEGVHRFLKKAWRLFHNNPTEDFEISEEVATKAELKILHKTIKKATEDIEHFSFNTSVSAFMVCVNELQDLKCNKRSILEPFLILLSPYAPHICEELWKLCGHADSIEKASWPSFNADYLIENEFYYPISFNGKVRFNLNFALDMDLKEVEVQVIANEQTQQYLEGKTPKKVIVVKGRIVNVVV
ncbi:MAG: leucine--tRNA ligase [bacterium]|nr:leucine--tRNA ligase [bacterium]